MGIIDDKKSLRGDPAAPTTPAAPFAEPAKPAEPAASSATPQQTITPIEIPQELIEAGARFILIPRREKAAFEPDFQTVNNYGADSPKLQAHLAAGGNYGVLSHNGVCFADVDDPVKFGENDVTFLKDTFIVIRGESGRGHLYFTCSDCPQEMRGKHITPWGDIRLGGNFYVVGANCTHPSGDTYNIFRKLPLKDVKWADVQRLLNGSGKPKEATGGTFNLPDVIPEGGRNDLLYRYGCSLRALGRDSMEITTLLAAVNKDRCRPPLPEEELVTILRQVIQHKKGSVYIPERPFPVVRPELLATSPSLTEIAAAEQFVISLQGNFLYNVDRNKWHIWNGRAWGIDNRNTVKNRCRVFVKSLYHEISALDKKDERRKWLSNVEHLNTNRGIENIIALAGIELPSRTEDFDVNIHLLNVQNGTLEFSDDRVIFREHRKEDMCSKICNTEYLPDVPVPEKWLEHIKKITCGDAELANAFQTFGGYILDGGNPLEKVCIAHGAGRNGKSVTYRLQSHMLGDYAVAVNPLTLMAAGSSQINPERLKMRNARLITAQESEKPSEESHKKDHTVLDTGFLKAASGKDKISARNIRSNNVEEFNITGVVVLITNPLPKVNDNSRAWWERLILQPFDYYFTNEEQNPDIEDEFKKMLPGILNWYIKGWALYHMDKKITTCDAMKLDLAEYRSVGDEYAGFVMDCVTDYKNGEVPANDMYDQYEQWCRSHGAYLKDKTTFGLAMSCRFSKKRKKSGNVFMGIALKTGQQPITKT